MINSTRNLILVIFSIIWAFPVFGQVIIPNVDPALPVELSSAVAWRVGSIAAIDGEMYYSQDNGDSTSDTGAEHVRSSVLLVYQPGNIVAELYYTPSQQSATSIDEETSNVNWEDQNATNMSLRIAIRGNTTVSVGLGYERFQYDEDNESYVDSLYEGSFSLRMFDGLLYAGGGVQRVTVERGSEDSAKYNKIVGGASMQIGDPIEGLFQAEAAVKLTPETSSENGVIDTIPRTTETQGNIEYFSGTFFLAVNIKQKVYESVNSGDNVTQSQNRYGAGIKFGGFMLGVYRKAWKTEYTDTTQEYDTYQVTLSYNFL